VRRLRLLMAARVAQAVLRAGTAGANRGSRAPTIRTTEATIARPAISVRNVVGSPRNAAPSRTATTGFTYAYVETMWVGAFRSSQWKALKATIEPTTTR